MCVSVQVGRAGGPSPRDVSPAATNLVPPIAQMQPNCIYNGNAPRDRDGEAGPGPAREEPRLLPCRGRGEAAERVTAGRAEGGASAGTMPAGSAPLPPRQTHRRAQDRDRPGRHARCHPSREGVRKADIVMTTKAAFYDVDGTLVRTNVVHTYAYCPMNAGSVGSMVERPVGLAGRLPLYGVLEALERKIFNETS